MLKIGDTVKLVKLSDDAESTCSQKMLKILRNNVGQVGIIEKGDPTDVVFVKFTNGDVGECQADELTII